MSQSQDGNDIHLQGGLCEIPYDLWDTHGDHENIPGWPFVSTDEIRRYFANRSINSGQIENTEMVPSPPPPPSPSLPLTSPEVLYDIYGLEARPNTNPYDLRNPFCKSYYKRCSLWYNSYDIPHSCIWEEHKISKRYISTIICKEGACTEKFSREIEFRRHKKTVHDKSRLDCPVPGCKRVGDKGFSRQDNLIQHRRKVHKQVIPRTRVEFGFNRITLEEPSVDARVGTFELVGVSPEAAAGGSADDMNAETGNEDFVVFERVQNEE